MENVELEFRMVGMNPRKMASVIEAVYRSSLIALGKSPDAHIYSLDDAFLKEKADTAAGAFLQKAKDLYESFDGYERVMFLAEVLEPGRYYPFWYLPFAAPREYGAQADSLRKKVAEAF